MDHGQPHRELARQLEAAAAPLRAIAQGRDRRLDARPRGFADPPSRPLTTLETVITETSARAATSRKVGLAMPPRRPVPPAMPLHATLYPGRLTLNSRLQIAGRKRMAGSGGAARADHRHPLCRGAVRRDGRARLMDQAMRPFVRPLDEALVLFGRARTGLYMPRYQVEPGEQSLRARDRADRRSAARRVAVFACAGPATGSPPGASCSAPPPRCAGRPAASPTGWCATCAQIRAMGFRSSPAASARSTARAAAR